MTYLKKYIYVKLLVGYCLLWGYHQYEQRRWWRCWWTCGTYVWPLWLWQNGPNNKEFKNIKNQRKMIVLLPTPRREEREGTSKEMKPKKGLVFPLENHFYFAKNIFYKKQFSVIFFFICVIVIKHDGYWLTYFVKFTRLVKKSTIDTVCLIGEGCICIIINHRRPCKKSSWRLLLIQVVFTVLIS